MQNRQKIALISPGREGSVVSGRWKGFVNFYRLTLPLLAGMTPEDTYEVSIFDESVEDVPLDEHFDLVAMSVMTPYAHRAYELADHFRQDGTKVVLGGHHPTLLPREVRRFADVVATGDSEFVWPQILEDFQRGELAPEYGAEGVAIKQGKKVRPERGKISDKSWIVFNTVEASRGCPYVCDYCTIASFYHSSYGTYSINDVVDEISSIEGKYLFFVDDNFIGGSRQDKERTKKLLKAITPLRKKWFCQATVMLADDPELLYLAKEAGCVGVYLGLESISEESLGEVNKRWNKPDSYVERIKRIRDNGIAIEAGLIFGFDNEEYDVFERTAEFIEKTGVESPNAHILTPYPGTPLFDRMNLENRILTTDWSKYNTGNVVFQPKNMTPDELAEGYVQWYKETFSPAVIVKRLLQANFKHYSALINIAKGLEVRKDTFSTAGDKISIGGHDQRGEKKIPSGPYPGYAASSG